ncbi:MAG: DUF2336 domain-containing protein [Parvularculaceae bacterium]
MTTSDTAADDLPIDDIGLSPEVSPGASARALLVRKLLDIVVLPAARISANERSLTADLMLQVLDKVEASLRLEVSRRVCRVPEAPNALVRMLLLDEPEIAEPIIRHAESISEALLIECANEGKTAHREMIARRIDLTSSLADAIISHGEPEVCKLLLRREEYELSPSAIDIMVSRSTADREVQELLLRRRELEPAHGFMMFWWVDGANRKRILARFAMDRSIVQDAVQDLYPKVFGPGASTDPFVKEVLVMLDRRHRPRGVNGEPVSLEVASKTLSAARKYPAHEIIQAAGMIAGISRELVARILRDTGVEPFAVMCKSLGMPRREFFRIVGDPGAESPVGEARAEELLGIFDSMSRDFARAVLRYWDWDGNPRIAHITRLLGIDLED